MKRRVLAAVLAGGSGSRWRQHGGLGHKLLALLNGRAVLSHAVAAPAGVGLDVLVVAGSLSMHTIRDVLDLGGHSAQVIDNPRWDEGQIHSVRAALLWATGHEYDSVCIAPGDQPFIPGVAWANVAQADGGLALAVYGTERQRGAPNRIPVGFIDDLAKTGDFGARQLFTGRVHPVSEVACPGDPERVTADIDTPEDLARWS